MAFITALWRAPEVNPVNRKARSIPILNPFNVYGRVFFFGWFGFFLAFWAWYAFPPLLSSTIKTDLSLTAVEIANSNIIALTATLLVRLVAGPMCDLIGPRYTFAICLMAGAIPSVLAGTVSTPAGLYVIRFFVGILGGSFVPCQVWSTGFFDKNVVGTSNALAAGWGNSGGGVTYFIMPAIVESLMTSRGMSGHVAWRVAFIVPFILITAVAIGMILCCPDTPTGKWSQRHLAVQQNLQAHGITGGAGMVSVPGGITEKPATDGAHTPNSRDDKRLEEEAAIAGAKHHVDHEAVLPEQEMLDTARGEVVVKPSLSEMLKVLASPQTLVVAACYFNSFGAELAINSILGNYYLSRFPTLLQSGSGNWAAMFGLLNIVCRPIGGIFSDFLYRRTHSLWSKKILLHTYGVLAGIFLIVIGVMNPMSKATLFGLMAGFAFFLEGGNGANYSLVPHIHPYANGIISGVTGASGNLGGIVFAIIFRYNTIGASTDYARSIWIIGAIMIGMNVAVSWIRPIPKGQIGGR